MRELPRGDDKVFPLPTEGCSGWIRVPVSIFIYFVMLWLIGQCIGFVFSKLS